MQPSEQQASMQSTDDVQQQQEQYVAQVLTPSAASANDTAPETGAVRKGRFWVTEGEDDSTPIADVPPNPDSISEIPPLEKGTEVRKGRFVVTVVKDEDSPLTTELEQMAIAGATAPIPGLNLMPEGVVADQSQVVVVQQQATEESQTAPQPGDKEPVPSTSSTHRYQAHTLSHQRSKKLNGIPQVLSELQRISQQNHKLHRMLKMLTEPDMAAPHGVNGPSTSQASTGTQGSQNLPAAGSQPHSSTTVTGNTGTNVNGITANIGSSAPINVASAADTARIEELMVEMQSRTGSLITEYDTLKSKNHLLAKQKKEIKQQLKESNLVIETLKQRLAQRDQRIAELERLLGNSES